MYAKVSQKLPPAPWKPSPTAPPVATSPSVPEVVVSSVEVAPPVEVVPEVPPSRSSRRAAPKLSWSEDMTRQELYVLAKKAGLEISSKDPKATIISKLKRATR
jgi:hypothetical protein